MPPAEDAAAPDEDEDAAMTGDDAKAGAKNEALGNLAPPDGDTPRAERRNYRIKLNILNEEFIRIK